MLYAKSEKSCRTTPICSTYWRYGILDISTPSNVILPEVGIYILSNNLINVVLPAPFKPTMPNFFPGIIEIFIFFSA